jgi:potassium-transporting ATPase potassium-binding subunit
LWRCCFRSGSDEHDHRKRPLLLSPAAALAVAHRFLGDYIYRVVTGTTDSRAERGVYWLVGVNPRAEQSWAVYARSIIAFSAVGILFLYAFMRLAVPPWASVP